MIVVAYIPKPWIGIVPVVTLAIGLPLAGHSEVTSCNGVLQIKIYILEIQKLTEYKVVWLLARWQMQRRRQAPKTAAGAAWQHCTIQNTQIQIQIQIQMEITLQAAVVVIHRVEGIHKK